MDQMLDRFNAAQYLASYGDLIDAFGYDLEAATKHYIESGYSEGRAVDLFDAAQYLASHGDLIDAFGYDLEAATKHYIESVYSESRNGTSNYNLSDFLVNAEEDEPKTFNFAVGDIDNQDTHTLIILNQPIKGSVVNNNDRTFTFDPLSDFQYLKVGQSETLTFEYYATGNSGDSNTATISVKVQGKTDWLSQNSQYNFSSATATLNNFDNKDFDISHRTYVITHGFTSSTSTPRFTDLTKAIEDFYGNDVNVISWDWNAGSGLIDQLFNYPRIANRVNAVGENLSFFLNILGIEPTKTTLIGHSLGAHLMGNAGESYKTQTGKSIDTIIGLDSAGPLFEDDFDILVGYHPFNNLDKPSNRLDASDADRVVALHTSKTLGYDRRIADLDLFVNWSDSFQPVQDENGKLKKNRTFSDNHGYAIDLLTQLFEGKAFTQGTGNDRENATTLVGGVFNIYDILNTSLTGEDYVETYPILLG